MPKSMITDTESPELQSLKLARKIIKKGQGTDDDESMVLHATLPTYNKDPAIKFKPWLGSHKGRQFIVKKMRSHQTESDLRKAAQILFEAYVFKLMNPEYMCFYAIQASKSGHQYYVIMEKISGSDLFDTFNDFRERPNLLFGVEIMRQLLQQIRQLHNSKLVHCDLKPENIMVARQDPITLMLIDGELATYTDASHAPAYLAPYYAELPMPSVHLRYRQAPTAKVRLRQDAKEKPHTDLFSAGLIGLILAIYINPLIFRDKNYIEKLQPYLNSENIAGLRIYQTHALNLPRSRQNIDTNHVLRYYSLCTQLIISSQTVITDCGLSRSALQEMAEFQQRLMHATNPSDISGRLSASISIQQFCHEASMVLEYQHTVTTRQQFLDLIEKLVENGLVLPQSTETYRQQAAAFSDWFFKAIKRSETAIFVILVWQECYRLLRHIPMLPTHVNWDHSRILALFIRQYILTLSDKHFHEIRKILASITSACWQNPERVGQDFESSCLQLINECDTTLSASLKEKIARTCFWLNPRFKNSPIAKEISAYLHTENSNVLFESPYCDSRFPLTEYPLAIPRLFVCRLNRSIFLLDDAYIEYLLTTGELDSKTIDHRHTFNGTPFEHVCDLISQALYRLNLPPDDKTDAQITLGGLERIAFILLFHNFNPNYRYWGQDPFDLLLIGGKKATQIHNAGLGWLMRMLVNVGAVYSNCSNPAPLLEYCSLEEIPRVAPTYEYWVHNVFVSVIKRAHAQRTYEKHRLFAPLQHKKAGMGNPAGLNLRTTND